MKKINNSPLVSIIIPVYNVQPYIVSCADSILNQSYDNLEIIFINDGSTDLSANMLDKIASEDPRVRVIHKENGGVSKARNLGLDQAKGEFVMFVDSDDWIDEHMVERMLNTAIINNSKIVSCGMKYVNMAGEVRDNFHGTHPLNRKIDSQEAFIEVINELAFGGGSLCCRLISRDLTDDVRFVDGMRVSEDQEWLLRIVQKTDSMIYIPESLYNVRVRLDSATTTSKPSDVDDIEIVNQAIILWARENDMLSSGVVLNSLFVRSRLQYSSGIRAGMRPEELNGLREKMVVAYKSTIGIHRTEKLKYCISLLPPSIYISTRRFLKRIRNESK